MARRKAQAAPKAAEVAIKPARQDALMAFDPFDGTAKPFPADADQWRRFHALPWHFNAWTGKRRHDAEVRSDVFGAAIVPSQPEVKA
jgi:hypothetical protein